MCVCVCEVDGLRDLKNVVSKDRNINGTLGGVDILAWILNLANATGTFSMFFAEVHAPCWSLRRTRWNKAQKGLHLGTCPARVWNFPDYDAGFQWT